MIKRNLKKLFVLSLLTLFVSCKTVPVRYAEEEYWLLSEKKQKKILATLSLSGVQVDRIGGWNFVEREVADLTPLYFWNNKCKVVAEEERPYYTAEVQVRERDFNVGWKTKKSLAVEVRIWARDYVSESESTAERQKLPAAAGRIVTTGKHSFSSSKITSQLLSKAIGKTVKKLAKFERQRKRNSVKLEKQKAAKQKGGKK